MTGVVGVSLLIVLALPAHAQEPVDIDSVGNADQAVEVVDDEFVRSEVVITAGETVAWGHFGENPHTVTADDNAFDSHPGCPGEGCMRQGDVFAVRFDEPGEYPYFCRVHREQGMVGVVVVQPAETTVDPTAVTGTISIEDQTGSGFSVTVPDATIEGARGFVVVRADADGQPGAVLGHTPIPQGSARDSGAFRDGVPVDLDRQVTETTTLWAMLHLDTREVGVFEFPGPDEQVTQDGQAVARSFRFTLEGEPDGARMARTGTPLLWLAAAALAMLGTGAAVIRRAKRELRDD